MSIFPSETTTVSNLISTTVASSVALPLAKEYAWDFINNKFLLVDGKNLIVTGRDAVKVWIWKALQTQKNIFRAYILGFGNDLEALIASGLSRLALNTEIERYLKESLFANLYITGISDISISIDGSKANVTFTAKTVYGEVIMSGVI